MRVYEYIWTYPLYFIHYAQKAYWQKEVRKSVQCTFIFILSFSKIENFNEKRSIQFKKYVNKRD